MYGCWLCMAQLRVIINIAVGLYVYLNLAVGLSVYFHNLLEDGGRCMKLSSLQFSPIKLSVMVKHSICALSNMGISSHMWLLNT